MNNHRQLMIAWRMYAEDNRDVLLYSTATPGGPYAPYLGFKVLDYNPGICRIGTSTRHKKSPMWQYCGNSVGIWKCPADRSTVVPSSGPLPGKPFRACAP